MGYLLCLDSATFGPAGNPLASRGGRDRHICTVDAIGVAFAFIQALHRHLVAWQQELATLRQQLAALQGKIAEASPVPPEPPGNREFKATA